MHGLPTAVHQFQWGSEGSYLLNHSAGCISRSIRTWHVAVLSLASHTTMPSCVQDPDDEKKETKSSGKAFGPMPAFGRSLFGGDDDLNLAGEKSRWAWALATEERG